MSKEVIRVFETFAGYGGASFGLKLAKVPHKVVGFSEWDKYAIEIFKANHPGIELYPSDSGDITKINENSLPDFDLFTGGFPCQPFSSAGLGNGELDMRGTLFYDILRIVSVKKPKHILLENVKGMTHKKHKPSLDKIISELKSLGYQVFMEILNTKDYGIPQNRERLWIYARLNGDLPSDWSINPGRVDMGEKRIKDFLDTNPEENLWLNEFQIDRLIEKHKVDFNVSEPLCLDIYNKKIRTDGMCITITEPHHNSLRIVYPPLNGKFRVRKLSMTEHFRLMGFPDNLINFAGQSYQQVCKRAGNGWDINVVSKIMKRILIDY
jgi:DNA (cytosine-5)-methyltransferase 1